MLPSHKILLSAKTPAIRLGRSNDLTRKHRDVDYLLHVALQRFEFIGQLAQGRGRGLGSVLGHQAHQEEPTGLLQLWGRLHAGIVRGPAALVATNLWLKRAVSEMRLAATGEHHLA